MSGHGSATPLLAEQLTTDLVALAAECSGDPLRFVDVAFPWGEPGTPLADHQGPDAWQADVLRAVGEGVMSASEAIQLAVASGHGVGKSTMVAWLCLWAMATCEDTRGLVTANTGSQLSTKTWPELAKWHRLCLFRGWFEMSATAIYSTDPAHERSWRLDATPWSQERVEAFAGLHNAGKRILVIFDEASAIPNVIWETTEGALTDGYTQIIWAAFGNPTRNSGRFRECFGRFRHRWTTRQVDSRSVKITSKGQIAQWIEDWGEDSDFVRVRVRGVFPRAGSMQFIDSDLVEAARTREAVAHLHDPLVIGVDVARQGEDQTVITIRKGRDARTFPTIKMRVPDLMAIAAKVWDLAAQYNADAVFVDGGGVGAGVIDRLRQLRLSTVIEVQFGGKADRGDVGQTDSPAKLANKRAEMFNTLRAWLAGGAIADDPELIADLTSIEFGHDAQDRIQLERKVDMKKRGLSSPDCADALALTFAYPVSPSASAGNLFGGRQRERREYDPHGFINQEIRA